MTNVVVTYDYDMIKTIPFKLFSDRYCIECDTIMTYDTETSNGVRQPDGSVVGFDHVKYATDKYYHMMIDSGVPVSVVYMWQFAIETPNGVVVFLGRTMEELERFIDALTCEIKRQSVFGINSTDYQAEIAISQKAKQYVNTYVYIHNFGFDFQELRNIYNKDFALNRGKHANTFARSLRKPMKSKVCRNKVNINFRDTLVLTNKSLKNWGKDEKLDVQKINVDKDYYLEIRTPQTPLSQLEIDYAVNDVVTMILGIQKYREKYGHLKSVSLTQTGEIRRVCRKETQEKIPWWSARCHEITVSYNFEFFTKLCHLFQGGWTHANCHKVGRILRNIKCFDFASSYPAVMCTRKYPITAFEECDLSEFDALSSQNIHTAKYRWFMRAKFKNVITNKQNTYWSSSKTRGDIKGYITDNGRIYAAAEMEVIMSDLDYDTFRQAYNEDEYEIEVLELYKSEAGYLPVEIIELILSYYNYKTTLKDVENAESRYNEAKQFINSIYGVSVTKLITDSIDFIIDGETDGWKKTEMSAFDYYETISNEKPQDVFLTYQIGIWVTSWARHNLWDFILQFDEKIAYCDTDSIKGEFDDNDLLWIKSYNGQIAELENAVADELGFDPELFCPKTPAGKTKRLGIMDREDDCVEFATLGAKRYCYKIWNMKKKQYEVKVTVAGLPKNAGKAKIHKVKHFLKKRLVWSTAESEKLIAYYNDDQPVCTWTDKFGKQYTSAEKYGICLLPTTFDLSIKPDYIKFIETVTNPETYDDPEINLSMI